MVTAISGNHHRLDFLIGPGKALDTNKYFVVATDAIGNGLSASPSNSTAQPRMNFPKFLIRDMVQSQHRLLTEHLGIGHVVAVVGPSMGGMQALQWGVSHPDFMDSVVALLRLARPRAWSVAVREASRKAIMLDRAWSGGNYTSPPEKGIRLWRDILGFLAARSPEMYRDQFQNQLDVLPWLEAQETNLIRVFDANDWIYQTWAYDRHDVGTTPGMNGDYVKALRAIKAKTIILNGTKDLLNPEFEPQEAARYIRDVRVVTISPGTITGHAAAGGTPAVPSRQLAQLGEEIEHALDRELLAAAAPRGAAGHVEVLPHREIGEDPAVLGHEAEAGPGHAVGRPARDVPTPP